MYGIEELRRGLRRPREAAMEVNAIYNRLRHGAYFNPAGVDIFAEDWDALVLLDSFRYDVFRARSDLPGRLERRTSRGGGTVEFLYGNFDGRDLRDTVYVTANPQFHKYRHDLDTKFHAVRNIWRDNWHEKLQTVHPETMTEACLEAASEYPQKRLLFHYNQPHPPYIGPKGRALDTSTGPDEQRGFVAELVNDLFHDFVSRDDLREAYTENADVALDAAEELLAALRGRVVVTADHGEMLGERASPLPVRYYSHRIGVHVDELTEVPWLVSESTDRPDIRPGDAECTDETAAPETVSERLRDLGYVE